MNHYNADLPLTDPLAPLPVPAAAIPQSPKLGDIFESLVAMLRRRIWVLVAITGSITIAACIVISLLKANYEATVRLRLDPTRSPMVQDQTQSALNAEAIETEINVMTSLDLAREVVKRLHIDRDPEFGGGAVADPSMDPNDRLNGIARRLMQKVTVNRDQLSYIVALDARSADAEKAARIANTFAETYMDLRVNARQGTSERQATFFKVRLAELAKELNAAEARLAAYRATAGISESAVTGTIVDQQIVPLSSQLATAQAAAATAASNASIARAQVQKGALDEVPGVQESNVIRDLRIQRAEIVRSLGEVTPRYGPKFPDNIRVRQQLSAIDQQIREEANRIVSALQAQAAASAAQVASLRTTMQGLEVQRAGNTRNSAIAQRLERDAASTRAQYDKMSTMSLASTQEARSSIAQAEIVDRAQPPSGAAWPKRKMLAALSFVGALATGLLVVLLLEMMQGGLRTVSEIEEQFGVAVLASLPMRGKGRGLFRRRREPSPADGIGVDDTSVYSEAIRNLRLSLTGFGPDDQSHVFAFTSALPDEGKTTTALSFARMLAVDNKRTLLIDCDLRNAGLRHLTAIDQPQGLVELLSGEATLASAVAADRIEKLDLLSVTAPVFTSQDLFGDHAMGDLLKAARAQYDAIVLDLPPVLGVADARTLSLLADNVAFIVRWGKTSARAVRSALSILRQDGVSVGGVVYTMVDPASEAAGGSYYSRGFGKYYLSK